MPLTELAVKRLKPKSKTFRIHDGSGLYLEVTPKGNKLWRLRYWLHGKDLMHPLGKYPAISLSHARKQAREGKELAKLGVHLTHEKKNRKRRQEQEFYETFEKYAREWHKAKCGHLNKKHADNILRRLEKYVFPDLGHLHPTKIKKPDIVYVLEKITKRGTIETAKRVGTVLGQIFRWLEAKGVCTYNPAANLKDIMPRSEEKHFACLPPSDFPALLQAMAARKKDVSSMAMELLALTFVRTSEIVGAMWTEIKWDRAEWHIPAERMKMKVLHIVPLSKQSLAILRDLHELTGDTPFVFYSSASKSRHLSNTVFLMALRRMEYDKRMTGHGFRSMASTILNEKGYNRDAVERQLAHKEKDKVRDAYNHAQYLTERKTMMQEYADMIDAMRETGKSVITDDVTMLSAA